MTAVTGGRLPLAPDATPDEAAAYTRAWVADNVPRAWREAAARGGARAVREVRSRADYEAWYPTFGASGLVAPTWPVAYGGLDLSPAVARAVDAELRPLNLGRLNPLGLNLAAPALFATHAIARNLKPGGRAALQFIASVTIVSVLSPLLGLLFAMWAAVFLAITLPLMRRGRRGVGGAPTSPAIVTTATDHPSGGARRGLMALPPMPPLGAVFGTAPTR